MVLRELQKYASHTHLDWPEMGLVKLRGLAHVSWVIKINFFGG
jgi:hypothetical protein